MERIQLVSSGFIKQNTNLTKNWTDLTEGYLKSVYKQKPRLLFVNPLTRLDNIKMVISLAAQNAGQIFQMAIKSAFLNAKLEEELYVDQPADYVKKGQLIM